MYSSSVAELMIDYQKLYNSFHSISSGNAGWHRVKTALFTYQIQRSAVAVGKIAEAAFITARQRSVKITDRRVVLHCSYSDFNLSKAHV